MDQDRSAQKPPWEDRIVSEESWDELGPAVSSRPELQ